MPKLLEIRRHDHELEVVGQTLTNCDPVKISDHLLNLKSC